jgi:hypothetical protein
MEGNLKWLAIMVVGVVGSMFAAAAVSDWSRENANSERFRAIAACYQAGGGEACKKL